MVTLKKIILQITQNIFKPQLISLLDELFKKRFEEYLSSDKETQITILQSNYSANNLDCRYFYGNIRVSNKNIR